MKMYAERRSIAARQMLADGFLISWTGAWIVAGVWVNNLIEKLGLPGQKLQEGGTSFAGNLNQLGGEVDQIPLVGDKLTGSFAEAADASTRLADTGRRIHEMAETLALVLGSAIAVVPIALALGIWVLTRLRWTRRAAIAARVRADPAGRDLLAMRALAGCSLKQLDALGSGVAQAWRQGDPAAVDALASLELDRLGLRLTRA
ncbi:MAG TPA: hypothetical protein VLL08_02760 [Kineosporiaceae bacterium]|nr:hypothetical protein [Kineosporiaceae bacterium]